MKNALLVCFLLFALAASAQLETLKNAAKSKLESQDFNSQRSNKERNMLNNKKRSAPANAVPSPPPPPGAPASEPADSTDAPVVSEMPVSGNSYTFDRVITYEMDDPSKPEQEKTAMTYYYGETAMMSVMPEQEMAMIYDFGDETMTTVNEKDRTATVMAARWIGRAAEKQAASDVTITKTGQTKTILGYTCEEYVIQDPKNRIVCWVTTEIPMDYTKFLQVAGKNVSKAYTENFDGRGVSMEVTTYDRKDRPESHMIMTDYREETLVKDLGGYEVTSLIMR